MKTLRAIKIFTSVKVYKKINCGINAFVPQYESSKYFMDGEKFTSIFIGECFGVPAVFLKIFAFLLFARACVARITVFISKRVN